jgi:hypothetical protein
MSGSGFSDKVLLTTLWQRTSDNGNEYLSGFLGKARIIGFRGQPTADGIPTWDIYLQFGKEQEERKAASSARTASSSPRPRQQQQRREPDPGPPFYDDPIDDIGRSR